MDVVITYVDDTEGLRKEYAQYCKKEFQENRFRSYGVLDLQVRGIRKYMPYVKNIFIVVNYKIQVKDYDFTGLDVKIIEHRQIIPKLFLPCFNSCAIEMFLHNIPNLDEEFVYFNDDCFIINDIPYEHWFKSGKPCLHPIISEINKYETNTYKKNLHNSTQLVCNIFSNGLYASGKYITQEHCPRPFLKSTIKTVWSEAGNEIKKSLTRLRNSKNYNATLFNDYDYLNDNCFLHENLYTYVNLSDNNFSELIDKKYKPIICINDNGNYDDFNKYKKELHNSLKTNIFGKEIVKPKPEVKKEVKPKKVVTPLKVAICAIAKAENLYVREWVEWYKNLGISKIFIYDNNEIYGGERFEDVINDYIKSGFVEIVNRRGITLTVTSDKDGKTLQGLSFKDCFYNNYKNYDYICFFDIDEYLEIYDHNKYENIYEFLHDFDEFDGIRVQWKMYGDNDNIYYENKPLFKRFKNETNASYDRHVKQILNCNKNFDEELIFCAHGVFNKKFNFVNINKQPLKNVYMDIVAYDNLPVYLNHFYSKSTEEFFKRKFNKPSAVTGINNDRNFNLEFLKKQYFEHNKFTEEKDKYIDIFINTNDTINVYMASLYKDGNVIESIKSIIRQPQVKSLTLSANNYTDEQYNRVISEVNSPKLIVHRTNNEKKSFEKLRFVNDDTSTKYVAFCDDDLVFYDGYFRKMISECEALDSVVSYHGAILKKPLPIEHYYPDRKSFSFNKEVPSNKEVDIIGNGVSLIKREWLTEKQWKDIYDNAPKVSMDDIIISYMLRKNGKKLIVVKHSPGDVIERKDNKITDTVYNLYKKNDSVQTDWVNKYFISL